MTRHNKSSSQSTPRNFNIDEKKLPKLKARWKILIQDVPQRIKNKAGTKFFNPFRDGIYFAQVQALYILGSNTYHHYHQVEKEIKEILIKIIVKAGSHAGENKWQVLTTEPPKLLKDKDYRGKIQHNYQLLQRLTGKFPYGHKLAQVHSCIDIELDEKNEVFKYKLNTTFKDVRSVNPYYSYTRTKRKGIIRHITTKEVISTTSKKKKRKR